VGSIDWAHNVVNDGTEVDLAAGLDDGIDKATGFGWWGPDIFMEDGTHFGTAGTQGGWAKKGIGCGAF
jgi:hypothetical protein